MRINNDEEPPPHPADLEGWRQAISDGRLRAFRMEAVIGAIQVLGPNADKSVINAIVLHASEAILRVLRKHIGTNHRNRGEDMIDEAHGQLVQAIFTPDSADGKGLREAFVPRIRFRAADAIRADRELRKRECSVEHIEAASDAKHADDTGCQQERDEKLYVEQVLSRITDDRKRLAFRMHMEGIPLDSKRTASIAKALGVSSKTAGQWIEEVQAQLKLIVGEQS
ncbi:MAG: sigma-70 family RNA polymerase sigma factor [Planctomycetaceae bacterium]|nr:MAG: sigma-70 family RNA polymerase sigma factor [Planctomycetaceae bacterium]